MYLNFVPLIGSVLIRLLPFPSRNGQGKRHLLISANPLAVEILQNQWVVGRVFNPTCHDGIPSILKGNNRISTNHSSVKVARTSSASQSNCLLISTPFWVVCGYAVFFAVLGIQSFIFLTVSIDSD